MPALLAALALSASTLWLSNLPSSNKHSRPTCPAQVSPIVPAIEFGRLEDSVYADEAAHRLARAVSFATVSYDDGGPVETDPRWSIFHPFREFLFETFSPVFAHPSVTLETVNTLGILTIVHGSDSSLKPLMLTSHFDVVPVEMQTIAQWTHPPFAGVYDGKFIWGRGASDCKSLMLAQYEALTLLFSQGWQPRRSVVLAHGFDEETSGEQGALQLSKRLEELYGPSGILLLIDEGTDTLRQFGTAFAIPATTEKGYIDVQVTVGTQGGHSSVPPAHTGIGIMSQIVEAIEANPFQPAFAGTQDPILQFLACADQHAKNFPSSWRTSLRKGDFVALAKQYARSDPEANALISTTTAVDIISGGVKVNALPEVVTAIINHRIGFADTVKDVQSHLSKVIEPISRHHNLSFRAFANASTSSSYNSPYISLEAALSQPFDPAPHSPTSGPIWDVFSGSIRYVLKDVKNANVPFVVSPFASTGNTDTGRYQHLTDAIYRYAGGDLVDYDSNEHTVDEKTSVKNHVKIIEWLHAMIQNADALDAN